MRTLQRKVCGCTPGGTYSDVCLKQEVETRINIRPLSVYSGQRVFILEEEMYYTKVDELVGETPLMELTGIERKLGLKARLFAKLEFLNPTGSAKDRAALYMINEAEKSGELRPGGTIIEATSGNTGIGLASIGAARGYRVIIVMPDSMSEERCKLMKAYGAELVLTPGADGMKGSIARSEELKASIPGSIIAGQFVNEANPLSHFETTGPEICRDLDGSIDMFVAGIGTGGTITGTGRYLKSRIPDVRIIGVEPDTSPLLTKGTAGPHGIQGIGANFVPDILDRNVIDDVMTVSVEDSCRMARMIGSVEGILVGISSGAAAFAAAELARLDENENKRIAVLLPDSGDRYLSTEMFKE